MPKKVIPINVAKPPAFRKDLNRVVMPAPGERNWLAKRAVAISSKQAILAKAAVRETSKIQGRWVNNFTGSGISATSNPLGGDVDFETIAFNGNPASFYSLLDLFSTPLAAGAVNGTLPDVGGARVVTDTNSKLSIAGGVASFATGGVGWGNPGLWYSSLAREFGKALLGTINISTQGANGTHAGWDLNQAGTIGAHAVYFQTTGSTLVAFDNGVVIGVGVFADNTAYSYAIVLRGLGAYYFYNGGTFTKWTLIWISGVNNTSTLYPAVVDNDDAHTADNIRVPKDARFIPVPLAYDTFTRADGVLGSTELVGPDGSSQVTPALAWTGATFAISTNKAVNTPTIGAEAVTNGAFAADTDWNKGAGWTIAAGTAVATAATSDLTAAVAPLTQYTWYQTAFTQGGFAGGTANVKLGSTAFPTHGANGTFTETGLALTTALAITGAGLTDTIDNFSAKPLTLSTLIASAPYSTADVICDINCTLVGATDGKQIGIVTNLDSAATPANFRLVVLDGRGNLVIYDVIAGAYTVKATTAITYSAAAALRVVVSGTSLRAFYNNATVGTVQTMAANTSTTHGIFSTSPLSSQDVWQAFSVGTDGAYVGLDAL